MEEKKTSTKSKVLKKILITFTIVCLAVLGWAYYIGNNVVNVIYTAEELGTKIKGHIVADFGGNAVSIWGVIDAPAKQIWKVIRDKENFEKFLPYVSKSTLTAQEDGTFLQEQIFNLPFGTYEFKHNVWYETTENSYVSHWQQTTGPVVENQGSWTIIPAGEKTLLNYKIRLETQWIPSWFLNAYMAQRLKLIITKLRIRIPQIKAENPKYFEDVE